LAIRWYIFKRTSSLIVIPHLRLSLSLLEIFTILMRIWNILCFTSSILRQFLNSLYTVLHQNLVWTLECLFVHLFFLFISWLLFLKVLNFSLWFLSLRTQLTIFVNHWNYLDLAVLSICRFGALFQWFFNWAKSIIIF
jgi:hypothetical protein